MTRRPVSVVRRVLGWTARLVFVVAFTTVGTLASMAALEVYLRGEPITMHAMLAAFLANWLGYVVYYTLALLGATPIIAWAIGKGLRV